MKTLLALAAMSFLLIAPASADIGTPYGTRNPATCSARNVPASGPPTAEQAARYLACEIEHESSSMLYLITNVKVQVAKTPRPYDVRNDSADQIDVTKPVYNIRGSYRKYACSPKTSYLGEQFPGNNCSYADQTNASGLCWITSFGEWRCRMIDAMHLKNSVDHAPPPQ